MISYTIVDVEIGKVVVEVVDKRDLHQLKDVENYILDYRGISTAIFNSRSRCWPYPSS
jgi:hypothetical protein